MSRGRPLSEGERRIAHEVFGKSLRVDPIRITRDSPLAVVSGTSVCNRINLRSDLGHFAGDGETLARGMEPTLVHELVHCWQWQQGGVAYMAESLLHQGLGILRGRGRVHAYDWRRAERDGRPWHRWNPEQQAQCIEDWWVARRSGFQVTPAQRQAVTELRHGRGAPRHSLAGVLVGAVLGGGLGAVLGLAGGPHGVAIGGVLAGSAGAFALGIARPFRRR